MKHFYISFFLFAFFSNRSQNFTNGSVYNYNVGDTIVTSYVEFTNSQGGQSPPTWTYRIFTGKHFSAAMDTVFYTTHDVVTSYTCYPCQQIINSNNSAFYVTDLSGSAINFQFSSGSCGARVDTSYLNSCGLFEHEAFLEHSSNDTCFEPPTLAYIVIEGIGIFEHKLSLTVVNPFPAGFKTQLEWYRKANNRCGTSYGIPNGINDLENRVEKLLVYPNPFEREFTINVPKKGQLSIQNLLGQEIYKSEISPGINALDLVDADPGAYIVRYVTENKIYLTKLVKK